MPYLLGLMLVLALVLNDSLVLFEGTFDTTHRHKRIESHDRSEYSLDRTSRTVEYK